MAGLSHGRERGPLVALAIASAALLALRLYAARVVGFGDSEALYACYAMHPQPAYVDHPGLIGLIAGAIGHGGAPTPQAAHVVTALAATLLPWTLVLAARGARASWRSSLVAGLALAAAPEIGVGLFAMTPDLPLAFAWIGALGLAAFGLRAEPSSRRAAASFAFTGLLAGIACAAKASGGLLVIALVLVYVSRPARAHARTAWPWLGLALGALVAFPCAAYEVRAGFPMLRHRLVETQVEAGVSIRNVLALIGGQLAYVSPLLLVAAVIVARDLVRARRAPEVATRLCVIAFALPFTLLVVLCVWSRVAEPHWIAPALLALAIAGAIEPRNLGAKLVTAAIAMGFVFVGAAHAWVLVPASARLLPASADPKLDLASELVGWPSATLAVREVLDDARLVDPDDVPVVVGPHWTICAQLHAALGPAVAVGCDGPTRDDFDTWLPRQRWRRQGDVLFVTDGRFPVDLAQRFPTRAATRSWQVPVERGGRLARVFTLTLLEPRAMGLAPSAPDYSPAAAGAIVRSPASRMSVRSSASSGFGVVSSFSP